MSGVPYLWLAWAMFKLYFLGFLMAPYTYIYNEKNVRRWSIHSAMYLVCVQTISPFLLMFSNSRLRRRRSVRIFLRLTLCTLDIVDVPWWMGSLLLLILSNINHWLSLPSTHTCVFSRCFSFSLAMRAVCSFSRNPTRISFLNKCFKNRFNYILRTISSNFYKMWFL